MINESFELTVVLLQLFVASSFFFQGQDHVEVASQNPIWGCYQVLDHLESLHEFVFVLAALWPIRIRDGTFLVRAHHLKVGRDGAYSCKGFADSYTGWVP